MVQTDPHKYVAALTKAWQELDARDLDDLAEDSGSHISDRTITLPFFQTTLSLDVDARKVLENGKEVDHFSAILTLHYLLGCSELAPTGTVVPFTQASGGSLYFTAFKKRSIDRLAELFGPSPGTLLKAGSAIGAEPLQKVSAGILIKVFPKLPVTVIVWEGDEEVPASANLLFDEVALSILPTEDLAVVGSLVVSRLKHAIQ